MNEALLFNPTLQRTAKPSAELARLANTSLCVRTFYSLRVFALFVSVSLLVPMCCSHVNGSVPRLAMWQSTRTR